LPAAPVIRFRTWAWAAIDPSPQESVPPLCCRRLECGTAWVYLSHSYAAAPKTPAALRHGRLWRRGGDRQAVLA